MRRFFLKEYGSWSVFILSLFGGWAFVRGPLPMEALAMVAGLAIFMNSKVALLGWIRRRDTFARRVFILQVLLGGLLILSGLKDLTGGSLLYFTVLVMVFFLTITGREHRVYGELIGFGYLCLPGPLVVALSGEPYHLKVYLSLWAFYGVSVFKVRFFMKKTTLWRSLTLLGPVISGTTMALIGLSPIYALPHIENTLYGLGLRKKGLSYVGWTELLKAVLFTCLLWFIPPK